MFREFLSKRKLITNFKFRGGLSIIELVVATSIILIISIISYSSFLTLNSEQVLKRETANLIAILEDARSLTTSGKGSSNYGVFFELYGNKAVSFKGNSFNENDPENKDFFLNDSVFISEVDLADGGSEITFKRLKGETDQYGSIVLALVNASSTTQTIVVYPTGAIQKL